MIQLIVTSMNVTRGVAAADVAGYAKACMLPEHSSGLDELAPAINRR
jgi:hypothetical protein